MIEASAKKDIFEMFIFAVFMSVQTNKNKFNRLLMILFGFLAFVDVDFVFNGWMIVVRGAMSEWPTSAVFM